jgi:hypothetical protein
MKRKDEKKIKTKVEEIVSPFLKLLSDPNRFQKLEDGWVRDKLCGIEWGPTSRSEMDFEDAQAYCAKLGGRLPEVNELQSLVDYSRKEPATNTDIFPDTKTSWYWSGTTQARYDDCAWCVGFNNGNVNNNNKDNDNYVRPVRASQRFKQRVLIS